MGLETVLHCSEASIGSPHLVRGPLSSAPQAILTRLTMPPQHPSNTAIHPSRDNRLSPGQLDSIIFWGSGSSVRTDFKEHSSTAFFNQYPVSIFTVTLARKMSNIPPKLQTKILQGEFIDFSELLEANLCLNIPLWGQRMLLKWSQIMALLL